MFAGCQYYTPYLTYPHVVNLQPDTLLFEENNPPSRQIGMYDRIVKVDGVSCPGHGTNLLSSNLDSLLRRRLRDTYLTVCILSNRSSLDSMTMACTWAF